MKKISLIALLSFVFMVAYSSQTFADRIKTAYEYLKAKDYDKTRQTLDKELSKNPNNAGAKYIYSLFFLTKSNKAYHVDSSYYFVLGALEDLKNTDAKVLAEWKEIEVTDSAMKAQKAKIETMGYDEAKKKNTKEAYQLFVKKYPTAAQTPDVLVLIDNMAWVEARNKNTIEAYQNFLAQNPNAPQKEEATRKRDSLIFEKETQVGTLQSYVSFTEQYPENLFVQQAHEAIFARETIFHEVAVYQSFLKKYPKSLKSNLCYDWILAFYQEDKSYEAFMKEYPTYGQLDIVSERKSVESKPFFVIFEGKKFGYIDAEGEVRISPKYLSVSEDVLCEGIVDEFIYVSENNLQGVIDKKGNVIVPSEFDEVKFFDTGLFKVHWEGKDGLWHLGGYAITPQEYDDIEILNKYFIKVRKEDHWGLITYNGRTVTPCQFDQIAVQGDGFVQFKQGKKYNIMSNQTLADLMIQRNAKIKATYDTTYLINDQYIKVKLDTLRGIVDVQNKVIVPLLYRDVKLVSNAWAVYTQKKTWQLLNINGQPLTNQNFKNFNYNEQYIAAKTDKFWGVIDNNGKLIKNFEYDSIAFVQNIVLLFKDKKVMVEFPHAKNPVDMTGLRDMTIEKGNYDNAPAYVKYNKNGKWGIMNFAAEPILPAEYDEIHILDKNLFSVQKLGKVGLIDFAGKIVLAPKYEAISNGNDGHKNLFLGGSFGIFHRERKILIEPQYDTQLTAYSSLDSNKIYIANKEGYYGLIDKANKILINFDYLQIKTWQDSIAIVQNDDESWQFKRFLMPKVVVNKNNTNTNTNNNQQKNTNNTNTNNTNTNNTQKNNTQVVKKDSIAPKKELIFTDIVFIKESYKETIFIGSVESTDGQKRFGVYHNQLKKELLPLEYQVIYNIGTKEEPIFFTDKRVKDTFNVAYIRGADGKVIWAKAMKEYDYKRLICE
ncbi:MAG: hypothetical protein EAZ55_11815 [Cytophagales bacterium]|nr:MAG: hypothetical protein EAZ55_11815 [Cytophagales bacterium]